MKFHRTAVALALISTTAVAADPSDSCVPDSAPAASAISKLAEALKSGKAFDDLKTAKEKWTGSKKSVLDAKFLYSVEEARTPARIQSEDFDYEKLTSKELTQINRIYWLGLGYAYPDQAAPKTFQEYLKIVEKESSGLSTQGKFLLLSLIGQKLTAGYDFSEGLGTTSLERLFQNMREGGTQGGVCREIHAFLAEVTKKLGFTDVGMHTALYGQGNDTSGHALQHFRDPKTGEFYIQNYTEIINTHQKTLQGMNDISTRILAPLAGTSYIESLPGEVHLYRPRIGRWLREKIATGAQHDGDRPMLSVLVGNKEQLLRAEVEHKLPSGGFVKGFFVHSGYTAAEGDYQLDALGVAKSYAKISPSDRKYIDEVSYASHQYLGMLELKDPVLLEGATPPRDKQDSIFAGFNLAGTARINQVTGKLELRANIVDLGTSTRITSNGVNANLTAPDHSILGSLSYDPKGLPLKVELERSIELGPKTIVDQTMVRARTAYDKLHVVVDARSGQNKAYILADSGVYLFEGVEKMSAVGIRETIKAGVDHKLLGEFAVVLDASRIVSDGSNDPYYRIPSSLKLSAQWEKAVNRVLRVGGQLSATRGAEPYFLFEQPGTVTPELTSRKGDLAATVWTRVRF